MRVAYLEDDSDQAALILRWLQAAGHTCHHFDRGRALLRSLQRESFDLYLLDWHLPDIDGMEVLKAVRERAPKVPIIFATARDRDDDVARVLLAGADDYIAKPVREVELLARIQAVARRAQGADAAESRIEAPPFVLHRSSRTVERDGRDIDVTDKEFDLALFLFLNAGKVVSRAHLLEAVWGKRADTNTRTVDTHMSRLRSKLGLNSEHGWQLASVHQFGYRLERVEKGA
jgi:two-component system, OmpR family, response regulator RegX3